MAEPLEKKSRNQHNTNSGSSFSSISAAPCPRQSKRGFAYTHVTLPDNRGNSPIQPEAKVARIPTFPSLPFSTLRSEWPPLTPECKQRLAPHKQLHLDRVCTSSARRLRPRADEGQSRKSNLMIATPIGPKQIHCYIPFTTEQCRLRKETTMADN